MAWQTTRRDAWYTARAGRAARRISRVLRPGIWRLVHERDVRLPELLRTPDDLRIEHVIPLGAPDHIRLFESLTPPIDPNDLSHLAFFCMPCANHKDAIEGESGRTRVPGLAERCGGQGWVADGVLAVCTDCVDVYLTESFDDHCSTCQRRCRRLSQLRSTSQLPSLPTTLATIATNLWPMSAPINPTLPAPSPSTPPPAQITFLWCGETDPSDLFPCPQAHNTAHCGAALPLAASAFPRRRWGPCWCSAPWAPPRPLLPARKRRPVWQEERRAPSTA